jgi:hypothetical protein
MSKENKNINPLAEYFNLIHNYEVLTNGSQGFAYLYTCKVCFSVVLTEHLEQHVQWHMSFNIGMML